MFFMTITAFAIVLAAVISTVSEAYGYPVSIVLILLMETIGFVAMSIKYDDEICGCSSCKMWFLSAFFTGGACTIISVIQIFRWIF